ncbi:HORMA domain-containing protein [Tricladium varicosporioides]|nr:HORMA domain-containing protein [Hymenoscyphus varicosporioides]
MTPKTRQARAARGSSQFQKKPARPRKPNTALKPIYRPVTEIQMTQKHSFELVRIVTTATISTIAWIRGIFGKPEEYQWDFHHLDPADPTITYASFMEGTRDSRMTFPPTAGIHNWPIIRRGRHANGNKLLDWLEYGVADALEHGYLWKLQLAFHSGTPTPDNLLEAYTMEFSYEDKMVSQIDTEISGASIGKGGSMTYHTAQSRIYYLVNSVDSFMRRLLQSESQYQQPLPPGSKLTMNLIYNESCPKSYETKGFQPSNNHNPIFRALVPASNHLQACIGFHSIAIYLPDDHDLFPTVGTAEQQDLMSYRDMSALPLLSAAGKSIDTHGEDATESSRTLPKEMLGSLYDLHSTPNEDDVHRGGREANMANMAKIALSRASQAGTQDTQLLDYQLVLHANRKPVIPSSRGNLRRAVLPHPYASNLNESMEGQDKPHDSMENIYNSNQMQETKNEVACECEAHSDRNNLVKCSGCQKFQHLQCYGYYGHDSRASSMKCYTCLLSSDEKTLLSEMANLCIHRRIMHYFYAQSAAPRSLQMIAQHINRKPRISSKVLEQLEEKGYIEQVKETRRNTSQAMNQTNDTTYFKVTMKEEDFRKNFCNPKENMAHYWPVPQNSLDTPGRSLLDPDLDISTQGSPSPSPPLSREVGIGTFSRFARSQPNQPSGSGCIIGRKRPATSGIDTTTRKTLRATQARSPFNL